METVKARRIWRWLTPRAEQSLTPRKRRHLPILSAFRFPTSRKQCLLLHSTAMADAEEDFSSLPLPDRFSHKVCLVLPRGTSYAHIN